jgi:hypothetical protein
MSKYNNIKIFYLSNTFTARYSNYSLYPRPRKKERNILHITAYFFPPKFQDKKFGCLIDENGLS